LVTVPRTAPVVRWAAAVATATSDATKAAPAVRVNRRVNRAVIIGSGKGSGTRRAGAAGGSGIIRRGCARRWHRGAGWLRFAHACRHLARGGRRLEALRILLGPPGGELLDSSRRDFGAHRSERLGQDDAVHVRRRRHARYERPHR